MVNDIESDLAVVLTGAARVVADRLGAARERAGIDDMRHRRPLPSPGLIPGGCWLCDFGSRGTKITQSSGSPKAPSAAAWRRRSSLQPALCRSASLSAPRAGAGVAGAV